MTETEKIIPVILLIGQFGCGKSTFIKDAIPTSDAEPSDTSDYHETLQDCKEYRSDDCSYYLVETPGFNGTWAKDEDVAKKIVHWLRAQEKRSHHAGVTAILYITGNGQRDHKPLGSVSSILSKHAHLRPVTNVKKKLSSSEKDEEEHWTFEGKACSAPQVIRDILREKQVEGRGRETNFGLLAGALSALFGLPSSSDAVDIDDSKGRWSKFSNLWRRFWGLFTGRRQAHTL